MPPPDGQVGLQQTDATQEGINVGRSWLLFNGRGEDLSPREYLDALAIHLDCLPQRVPGHRAVRGYM